MKFRHLPAVAALAIFVAASCKKSEIVPTPPQKAAITNSDTSNTTTVSSTGNFSWNGVDPFSVLHNGELRVMSNAMFVRNPDFGSYIIGVSGSGPLAMYVIHFKNVDISQRNVNAEYDGGPAVEIGYVEVPNSEAANDVVRSGAYSYSSAYGGVCRIKVTGISTNSIQGKFYGVMKNMQDVSYEVIMKGGHFNASIL